MKLLTTGNTKTMKGEKQGYLTFIMHLAPAKSSGYNACPKASAGCTLACLNTAGRGVYKKVQAARVRKTKMFFENRDEFMAQLVKDIQSAERLAAKKNLIPVFRLNGTSDIRWETIPVPMITSGHEMHPNIMTMFPHLQFYDYTKIVNRKNIPANYHLTFSRSESNDRDVTEAYITGMNVAVVFAVKKNEKLPTKFVGRVVIDGDENDLRFLDPAQCIVGLRAKGRARKSTFNNFVVTP